MSRPGRGNDGERNKPVLMFREMSFKMDGRGRRDGSIGIAFSSEAPVERVDSWSGERYVEVLDHSPSSIDLSYASDGLPFLLDHETKAQIGILTGLELGSDRKLRGAVRMGSHPDAGWVAQDIRDGIRSKVSVGYHTGKYTERRLPSGSVERRYNQWTPMEVSSVAVPADYSVGVGRSSQIQSGAGAMSEERQVSYTAGVNQEQERASTLAAIASLANRSADLPRWIAEGRTVEDVRKEVMGSLQARAIADASSTTPAGHIDLTPREHQQFSITRAINAAVNKDWSRAGFEREVSETIRKQLGRTVGDFSIPMNLRTSVAGNVAGTSSLGGAGVQTTILSLIELLRNKMLVRQLGATVLPGLSSNISFPRQITANTITWTGENPSSGVGLTSLTMDNVSLTPKTAMTNTAYSKQVVVQSSPAIDALVSNDLATVLAQGLDLAALSGLGSSNQPKGIASQTGVIAVTMGTNGAVPTFANIVDFETQVAVNNGDIGTFAFLTTPGLRGVLKGTLKNTVAGSQYIWGDGDSLAGYTAAVSNQARKNLTKGTSTTICHEIFFGSWDQLLIGEFGGAVDILVDPYFYADQNMIRVVASMMCDVNVRLPKAFAYCPDALLA